MKNHGMNLIFSYEKKKTRREHVDQLEEHETQEDIRTVIKEEILPMDKKVDNISKKIRLPIRKSITNNKHTNLNIWYSSIWT